MFVIQDTVTKEYIAGRSHRRVREISKARVFQRKIDALNALYGDRNKRNLEVVPVVLGTQAAFTFMLVMSAFGTAVAERKNLPPETVYKIAKPLLADVLINAGKAA